MNSSKILLVLFSFLIVSCSKVYHLSDVSEDRYYVTGENGLEEEERITKIIAPYKKELQEIMDEQIGIASETMYKNRPESTLGNWFTDMLHEEAQKLIKEKVDFTIQNYGGLRVRAVSQGPITIGEIFELMPFENQIVIIEAKGIVVRKFFEHMAAGGGWPVNSSVQVKATRDGQIKTLKINGQELDPAKTYRFALPDYIANGGDRAEFLKELPRVETGVKIRDAIIKHLQESGPESVEIGEINHRFTYVN